MPSVWTTTRSVSAMAVHALATRAMLNVAIGGTAARLANDVAVNPTGVPSDRSAVIIATPAACRRNACLNADTPSGSSAAGLPDKVVKP